MYPFTEMITLGALYARLCTLLSPSQARQVITRRLGVEWATIIAHPAIPVAKQALSFVEEDVQRCQSGESLSRIYGSKTFWGMDFVLSADTLEPRPDTECLIEIALRTMRSPSRILDLGTGSGCILLSLLQEWPESFGVGVDISLGALETARANARTHGLEGRAAFVCSDWGAALTSSFDLIVSNPPYIKSAEIATLAPKVRDHDPIHALDGGKDGLDAYRTIGVDTLRLLSRHGVVLWEIGYDEAYDVASLAGTQGLCVRKVHRDLGGHERVIELFHGDNFTG